MTWSLKQCLSLAFTVFYKSYKETQMSDKDLGEGLENFEQEVENLKNTKMKIFGI